MKLKRLSSLVGLLAALLIFTGGRALAVDAIAVADAQAFPGGSDTVDVIVTTDAAYPGAEITLSYDKTKLSTSEANVIMNEAAWNSSWGVPQVTVDTAAGTIFVGLTSLSVDLTKAVPQSSSALKLFSVVFEVDSTVAVGSYMITPSGKFLTVDVSDPLDPQFTLSTVTSLTPGFFVVQSLYNMSIDSVDAGPGVLTPVNINLSNGREAVSVEFTITYDSSQVIYGGSVEINDLYVGGVASAPIVNDFGDSLRVAILTSGTATIPVSNTSRWIAKVNFISAGSATVSASNPLTLSTSSVVTTTSGPPDYDFINNAPNLAPGNLNIQSKYSLRVGNAVAPQGGSAVVNVYLRSAETVNAVEAELQFNASKFTVSAADVTLNGSIFAGGTASVSVTTTDSTVKIIAIPSATDSIAASNTERLLFSVILNVDTLAAAGYDSINATGTLTAGFDPIAIPITTVTKGAFRVVSSYEIEVKSRGASPGAQGVPVSILLTNEQDISSAQVVVKYDTTKLSYVTGSVAVNDDAWSGTAPTPEVLVAGDSIWIGMIDLADITNKIIGGTAGLSLLDISFDIKAALVNGDSTMLTPTGLLISVDNTDPTDPIFVENAATGIAGYLKVTNDILPPDPVLNATAVGGETASAITLSWKNPVAADLDYVKVVRNSTDEDSTVVVMRDTPVSGATDSFEDATVATGVVYYYTIMVADNNGNMSSNVVLGPVNIGVLTQNLVSVTSATALAGGVAISKIQLKNPENIVAGLMLKLTFDATKLQLTDILPGADAAGVAPVSPIDIISVNSTGILMLDAADIAGDNPVLTGSTVKTVAVLEFLVDADVATSDVIALTLSDVSLSDPAGTDVELATNSGTVSIVGSIVIDANNDGEINIGDIWFYFDQEELVVFEVLAELVATLLAQPLPSSMLAAVQDAVATSSRAVDGAALINLNTNFEIVAARFTFSYDNMHELNEVFLSQTLAGQVMIKKVVADGRLYVDIVSLNGFVPAEVGELFSVAFRDVDHETAGLTLDKIEVSDRAGNVFIESAQAVRVVLPKAFSLSQNSPNPFNPSTTIKYQVPEGQAAKVQIVVFNVRGQKVITLVNELKESGDFTVNWNGSNTSGQRVSSGVYFYRMSAGEFSAVRKMVIVK